MPKLADSCLFSVTMATRWQQVKELSLAPLLQGLDGCSPLQMGFVFANNRPFLSLQPESHFR